MTVSEFIAQVGSSADTVRSFGEIAESLNIPRRAVEQASEDAKDAGIPLVDTGRGLYVAHTAVEALIAYRQQRGRALGQLRRAAAVKRTAFRMQRAEAHVQTLSLWSDRHGCHDDAGHRMHDMLCSLSDDECRREDAA